MVLDISWEKINTGHWKDVDPNWRYAFSFGSLFKVLCLLLRKNSNKLVRVSLMLNFYFIIICIIGNALNNLIFYKYLNALCHLCIHFVELI